MKTIKEEIFKNLNMLKDNDFIDTEQYTFFKSKAETTEDADVLERIHYVASYFVDFYKEGIK